MLTPDYFKGKSDRIIELYRQLEDFIMRDIAKRVIKSGELTATADRLIWKLEQMGEHKAEIMKYLAQMTGLTTAELKALLQDAVLTSWNDDVSVYDAIGVSVSQLLENPVVISVMDAEYRKSLTELQNLTRTTMNKSQRDLINMLDEAEMRVSSGIQSYSSALCDILDRYAGQGVKVSYPSGTEISLEAAVRMCVVTSMNQTAAQVTNQYIVETGTNYVLTSAHLGARVKQDGQPDLAGHDLWQGRVFCIVGSEDGYPNLLESTGYDIDPVTGQGKVVDPLGLHGYNCRHGHRPWDKRLRNPWRDKDGNLIDGNGDLISSEWNRERYEQSQKQRRMERAIRKTKRELMTKQEEIDGVAETDVKSILQQDYDKLASKLQKQNKVYNDFCKENDLQPDYVRNKVSGFGRMQQAQANAGARAYKNKNSGEESIEKDSGSDIIKSGARITDPESEEGRAFAKSFYPEIRKRTTDSAKIAKNLGKPEEDIQKVKDYLFIEKSLYDEDLQAWRRFDEDCAIAQSWQRLTDGKNIKQHDRTLIEHELYEMKLKAEDPDISHDAAHALAQKKYNYRKEVDEYYGNLNKSN